MSKIWFDIAGFEDGGRELCAKEYPKPLEAGNERELKGAGVKPSCHLNFCLVRCKLDCCSKKLEENKKCKVLRIQKFVIVAIDYYNIFIPTNTMYFLTPFPFIPLK